MDVIFHWVIAFVIIFGTIYFLDACWRIHHGISAEEEIGNLVFYAIALIGYFGALFLRIVWYLIFHP